MMKAMIFAAGLGTRLKPMTDEKPKALVEVAGVPMLGRLIEKLKSVNIEQIVINTHHFPEKVRSYIEDNNSFGIEIAISEENEELLDTGGGLARARWFLEGEDPILLHNVDIFSDIDLEEMLRHHQEHNPLATLAVRQRNSSRYLLFNGHMELSGWINEKTNETILVDRPAVPLQKMAFSGIHIVAPAIFDHLQGEKRFRIINKYLEIANRERIIGFEHPAGYLVDMGSLSGVKKAESILEA